MRKFFVTLFCVVCVVLAVLQAPAQTMHFIYFSNTHDSEVGLSSEIANKYFLYNFVDRVKSCAGLDVRKYVYTDYDFKLSKLNSILSSLTTQSNDVIFFYYTGHGMNDGYTQWPSLTFAVNEKKDLISIYNTLKAKPHRLLVVASEACNKVYGGRSSNGGGTVSYDINDPYCQNYRNLFANQAGEYLITSSKRDQKSIAFIGELGCFTRSFKEVLEGQTVYRTWESFFQAVSSQTLRNAQNIEGKDQNPIYEVHPRAYTPPSSGSGGGSSVEKKVWFTSVSLTANESWNGTQNLGIHIKFDVKGYRGQSLKMMAYLYSSPGNNVVAPSTGSYTDGNRNVAAGQSFTPNYDGSNWSDFKLYIPNDKLNISSSGTYYVRAIVWDGNNKLAVSDYSSVYLSAPYSSGGGSSSGSGSGSNQTIYANGVPIEMVYVQHGTFTMGATSEQGSDACSDEKPAHSVTLTRDYYVGKYEVTQKLWKAVMGNNPSNFKGDDLPVEQVSWNDVQEFLRKLNSITGRNFRLPTEAEWEFAARGGTKSRGYKYSGSNDVGSVAWYDGNSGSKTHTVGSKSSNELGIYDMTGNVWEWCQDWFDSGYYSKSPSTNPTGASTGSRRVDRGGSWLNNARRCRVSYRINDYPDFRYASIGFRLAL